MTVRFRGAWNMAKFGPQTWLFFHHNSLHLRIVLSHDGCHIVTCQCDHNCRGHQSCRLRWWKCKVAKSESTRLSALGVIKRRSFNAALVVARTHTCSFAASFATYCSDCILPIDDQ